MGSRYYRSGQARASGVRALFASVARRYDLINDLQSLGLHRWWKRRLVRWSAVVREEVVLDVCCGTGDVAIALARTGARVIGLDFSPAMLDGATARGASATQVRRRSRKLSVEPDEGAGGDSSAPRLGWIQGDALHLPLGDATCDLVTISYGLRNLVDFEKGLRELARVTKAGGRLLILDFGKPRRRWLRALYFGYLSSWVPALGYLVSGDRDAYRYILESLQAYPAQDGLAPLLEREGWTGEQTINLLGGIMSLTQVVRRDSP